MSGARPLRLACFGLPLAAYLLARDGHDVRFVVLAPVEAPGRRRLAAELGEERLLHARTLGSELEAAVRRRLAGERPDLIVSWFWTRRLPADWLELARLGGVGVHPSLLPRHRGPNPYFAAIDAGDRETGVTVHRLTPRYDEGEILARRAVPVGERDSWQLARALDRPSLALLRETVDAFARGNPPRGSPQDESSVTWAPEPEGELLHVDFRWPTERVLRRVRALAPVPGALLDVEGLELVVLRASSAAAYPTALEPGEAAVWGEPSMTVVRTGDGAITLDRALLDPGQDAAAPLGRSALAEAVRTHLERRAGA